MDSSKIAQRKRLKTNKIHWILNESWRKNKWMFPDFSGKYHGKINENISRKTAEKISKNATAGKKALTEKLSEFKGKA